MHIYHLEGYARQPGTVSRQTLFGGHFLGMRDFPGGGSDCADRDSPGPRHERKVAPSGAGKGAHGFMYQIQSRAATITSREPMRIKRPCQVMIRKNYAVLTDCTSISQHFPSTLIDWIAVFPSLESAVISG